MRSSLTVLVTVQYDARILKGIGWAKLLPWCLQEPLNVSISRPAPSTTELFAASTVVRQHGTSFSTRLYYTLTRKHQKLIIIPINIYLLWYKCCSLLYDAAWHEMRRLIDLMARINNSIQFSPYDDPTYWQNEWRWRGEFGGVGSDQVGKRCRSLDAKSGQIKWKIASWAWYSFLQMRQ